MKRDEFIDKWYQDNWSLKEFEDDLHEVIQIEGYAATKSYSPEVARHLLKMRDLLIQRGDTDIDEVYHELYQIADPTFEKKNLIGETWAEMERIANIKPGGE